MDEPVGTRYFKWLYSSVSDIGARMRSRQFYNLFAYLHGVAFNCDLVRGDSNRAEDGVDLRTEFYHQSFLKNDGALSSYPCSILEMLIAFSHRASFQTDDDPHVWFWTMLGNLGLSGVNDAVPFDTPTIEAIVTQFNDRTYDRNGNGGLFPLQRTENDQRKVEIWYQFSEFLYENGYV